MLPLKVVLDTNVIVSAALQPRGLERTALNFAITRPARLYVSPDTMAEYAEVLRRPTEALRHQRRRQSRKSRV